MQRRIKGQADLQLTRRALLAAGAGALLGACSSTGGTGTLATLQQGEAVPTAGSGGPVKVALLLPLSKGGEASKVANDLKQAGELALFELNQPNIVLQTKDTLGTPEGAEAAAMEAIRDGAELVIGPLFANEVAVVAPVARRANVPVVAFSSDSKVAGNGVYLLSFVAGEEIPRALAFAAARGKRRFAALIPQTPYGEIVESRFRTAAGQLGIAIVAVESYPLDASGMMDPIKRMKQHIDAADQSGSPIDALLFPGGQDTLPTVAAMLPYYSIDTTRIQLVGTGGWDYPNVGNEAALVGGWFAGPDPQGWRDFSQRYARAYGPPPARIASLAYDGVGLSAALAGNPPGQRFTTTNLTRASGFAGVDGLFRLRPDGTSERGLAMLEVQKFGARVIDPAPSTFGYAEF